MPICVLAADSPERVAALLTSPALSGITVIVSSYGPVAAKVGDVAVALGSSYAGAFGDRWAAFAGGLARGGGANDAVLLLGQEAVLAADWLAAARSALEPSAIATKAGPKPYWGTLSRRPNVGRVIRIVAPVSEQASSADQRISLSAEDLGLGVDGYAQSRRAVFGSIVSPLAMPCPLALFIEAGPALELRPECGPWTFADLVVRMKAEGVGTCVAEGWYVGSVSPAAARPETPAASGREPFAALHSSRREPHVWGAVRIGWRTLREMALTRASLARLGPSVDGIVLLVATNPLEVQDDQGWKAAKTSGALDAIDRDLLQRCDGADEGRVLDAVRAWALAVSRADRAVATIRPGPPDDRRDRETLAGLLYVADPTAANEHRLWALRIEPGELVEQTGDTPESTRAFLRRICAHPSPVVAAYDVATLTLWDGPRSVREDPPWGDGGSWRGGPSEPRLYRVGPDLVFTEGSPDPVAAPEAVRVANLRVYDVRLLREVDRSALLGVRRSGEEQVKLAQAPTRTRIGLHVLAYEREAPEDLARWLDELHGLLSYSVIVWTGAPTIPSEVIDLAERAGAALVPHELRDHLAAARNVGIERVAAARCAWALFVDPDEWLTDPRADAIALRRMAESTRAGWLFQVANYVESGEPTISDSVRMSSTRPEMRMNGRVHEGFSDGIRAIQARGEHPRLTYARFVVQHRGMRLGASRTAEKLAQYDRLLRLELAENPRNPGAWVSLAWHLDNDGHRELAEEAFRRAVDCAGTAYLPFREVAVQRLREARVALRECVERLTPDHQYARHATELLRLLDRYAPDAVRMPSLGTPPEPLPPYPGPAGETEPTGYDPGEGGA